MFHFIKYFFKIIFLLFTSRAFRSDKYFRTFVWLQVKYGKRQRYEVCPVSFNGYHFDVPDVVSFLWQYKEIFVDRCYEFQFSGDEKIILDCGANIGLSALFFSIHYPAAEIIAYEADPYVMNYLTVNMQNNEIKNVKTVNCAVWNKNDSLSFGSEGADGGSVYHSSSKKVLVKAIRLKEVIDSYPEIDMLKMDIEGSERDVLIDCKEVMYKVKNLFVEYHDYSDGTQYLSELVSVLESGGFRYYVYNPAFRKWPMQKPAVHKGMDLQLNIFANKNIGKPIHSRDGNKMSR
ncbi:MAG: FkbM family methyltransferase [Bacteroidetes bacterium]|nr:FkbM family methyltransferase [Bacteroidota bacterium]